MNKKEQGWKIGDPLDHRYEKHKQDSFTRIDNARKSLLERAKTPGISPFEKHHLNDSYNFLRRQEGKLQTEFFVHERNNKYKGMGF